MSANNRIGFLQGRLSPLVAGKIQAFPWECWAAEFPLGAEYGWHLMEWTLDQARLYQNPLMTIEGRREVKSLCEEYGFSIPSLTGDCFMQAPFWKAPGDKRERLQKDFTAIAEACGNVGISMLVVPLVDNGRLDSPEQEDMLVAFLENQADFLAGHGLQVVFESDFGPAELARFIARLDSAVFGINYDIGNSAASGLNPKEEMAAYGQRILNVHVKDRKLGGTTVPLGTGNADFDTVFSGLSCIGYAGNYILQTARAIDDDHAGVLCRYRDMVCDWMDKHAV